MKAKNAASEKTKTNGVEKVKEMLIINRFQELVIKMLRLMTGEALKSTIPVK